MRGKLTKSIVAEALPEDKPYQIHDAELHGLLLRVEPSGSRSYYLEYRNAEGRRLRYRIGGYPGLDPDQARKLGKIAAGDVASGIAPGAEVRSSVTITSSRAGRRFASSSMSNTSRGRSRISSPPCR